MTEEAAKGAGSLLGDAFEGAQIEEHDDVVTGQIDGVAELRG